MAARLVLGDSGGHAEGSVTFALNLVFHVDGCQVKSARTKREKLALNIMASYQMSGCDLPVVGLTTFEKPRSAP